MKAFSDPYDNPPWRAQLRDIVCMRSALGTAHIHRTPANDAKATAHARIGTTIIAAYGLQGPYFCVCVSECHRQKAGIHGMRLQIGKASMEAERRDMS